MKSIFFLTEFFLGFLIIIAECLLCIKILLLPFLYLDLFVVTTHSWLAKAWSYIFFPFFSKLLLKRVLLHVHPIMILFARFGPDKTQQFFKVGLFMNSFCIHLIFTHRHTHIILPDWFYWMHYKALEIRFFFCLLYIDSGHIG